MKNYRYLGLLLLASLVAQAESPGNNKLLRMYQFFYLPFTLDFKEGRTANDVLPFHVASDPGGERLLRAEELQSLDAEWNQIREEWKRKSLLLATPVSLGESVRVTQRLVSHHIPLTRSSFDTMPINDRITVGELLKSRSAEVQAAFKQIRFLKSFTVPMDDDKFNFFIISPSWCESSREYRVLLETYLKTFPEPSVHLHSVVIEDPKEQIFDAKIVRELFPSPKRYAQESFPRFLAFEQVGDQTIVYEEGDALAQLYDRFYRSRRGFLDGKATILRKVATKPRGAVDPTLSSVTK